MSDSTKSKLRTLWNPTGGLFAIAFALIVLAIATGNSIFSHRYQFAASAFGEGQAVWRGDTVTGQAVLCVTDRVADRLQAISGIATRC